MLLADLPRLNLHLYAALPGSQAAGQVSISGHQLDVLAVEADQTSQIAVSMEQLAEVFEAHPRCYFEWDGSFVWTGGQAESLWQLYGMIYDLGDMIQRVELKGQCSLDVWRELGGHLGADQVPLLAHLIDQRQYVSMTELEKLWNA